MASLESTLRLTGATYRQLDHWARKGYLNIDQEVATGIPRDWPMEEVRVAEIVVKFINAGMNLNAAFTYARQILGSREDIILADGLLILRGTP